LILPPFLPSSLSHSLPPFLTPFLPSSLISRVDIISIVDTLRRALLTVTSSQECLIMTPNLDSNFISNEKQSKLFILEKESGSSREVVFDPLDIEYFALQKRKPIKLSTMSPEMRCWTIENYLSSTNWIPSSATTPVGALRTLYALVIPCIMREDELFLAVLVRSDRDYDSIDELTSYWFMKLLAMTVHYKRNELSSVILPPLPVPPPPPLQEEENGSTVSEIDGIESTSQLMKDMSEILQGFFSIRSHLSFHQSRVHLITPPPTSASPLPNLLSTIDKRGMINEMNPIDIMKYYSEIIFPRSILEIQTTMESITELNSLLINDHNVSHKDSIIIDQFRFIFWEDCNRATRHHLVIKGLLTFPELSEHQLWITLQDNNTTSHTNFLNYKFKFMIFFQFISVHLHQMTIQKQFHEEMRQEYEHLIELRQLEVDSKIHIIKDLEERSVMELQEMKEEHELIHQNFHQEIDQLKGKYHSHLQEKGKEKKFLQEFILQMTEVNQFLLSSGLNSTKKGGINISKIIRKVCEGINLAGLMDLAAAMVVSSSDGMTSTNTSAPVKSLSWISSSSNWVGTGTMSSPIAIAYDMKKIVLVVSSEEMKKQVYETSDIKAADEWTVIISSTFPDHTIIIPMLTSFDHHQYIFITKLNQNQKISFPLKLLFNCWSNFSHTMVSLLKINSIELSLLSQRKKLSIKLLITNAIQRSKMFQYQIISRAFLQLKNVSFQSKRLIKIEEENQSQMTKQQIRILERSLADWTELVKGINGASGGIPNGLPGLWSQACRPLMSIITSHVTLLSCGLLVASDDETVLDLNVEELSIYETYTSRYENNEEIEANIAVRPSTELGTGVQSLAWSILNGQAWRMDSTHSRQRLWKLSRGSKNGIEEQMWLVPLRTSTEVLGILRVTVEVPLSQETNRFISIPSTDYAPPHYVEEDSGEYLWTGGNAENAKRNLLNFAELFSPMVAATRLIEIRKSQEDQQDLEIEDSKKREMLFRNEANLLMRKHKLISEALNVISRACSQELTEDEISIGAFATISSRLNSTLSTVLGIDISIADNDQRLESNQILPSKIVSHPILLEGLEIGHLIAQIPIEDFSIIHHNDEGDLDDPHNTHVTHMNTILKLDENNLLSLLRMLSIPLAGLFMSFTREISIKQMVTRAVSNLHTMQHEVDDLTAEKDELTYRELISSESNNLHQQLYRLMKDITMTYEGYNFEKIELQVQEVEIQTKEPSHSHSHSHSHRKLQHLFTKISKELQKIFQEKCVVNFAISRSANTATSTSQLTWWNASSMNGSTSDGHLLLPSGKNADEKTFKLIQNLAKTSIESRSKSSVEIGVMDHDGDEEESVLRVITYPLSISTSTSPSAITSLSSKAFGVLQVCLIPSPSQRPPLTASEKMMDTICSQLSEVLTHLLSYELSKDQMSSYIHDSATSNNILKTTIEDLSKDCQVWRHHCAVWHEMTQLFMLLFEKRGGGGGGGSNGKGSDIEKIWELVTTSPMKECGFQISFKPPKRSELDSERYSYRMINLGDSEGTSIHLVYDLKWDFKEDVEKVIDALKVMFGVRVEYSELKQLNQQCLSQIESLKRENKVINDQCHQLGVDLALSSSAMAEQSDKILLLKRQLPYSLEGSMRPLIGDILSLFRQFSEMSTTKEMTSSTSLELTVEQSEQFFTIYTRTIASSLSRILSNQSRSRPYHVSVLVKSRTELSPDSGSQFTDGIVIFDGVSLVGQMLSDTTLLLDPSKGLQSLVHQCFQTNMTQTSSSQGNLFSFHGLDLIGVSNQQLQILSNSSEHENSSHRRKSSSQPLHIQKKKTMTTLLVTPLSTNIKNLISVIRIIFSEEIEEDHDSSSLSSTTMSINTSRSRDSPHGVMIQMITELFASLGKYSARSLYEHTVFSTIQLTALQQQKEYEQKFQVVQQQFLRYRKVYRIVCHEVSPLFDPPVTELSSSVENQKGPTHPASLSPLVALQDTCLKTLSIIRVLCRSDGQAILIKDQGNAGGSSGYRLLFTGTGLSWPGVEAGSFGNLTLTGTEPSLILTALQNHKSTVIKDLTMEKTYNPSVDGRVHLGSSVLLTPLRGRGNAIIGLIIAVKSTGGKSSNSSSNSFTPEDVIATELVATCSSLGLYWSNGLSSIHHKLSKTILKMEELESAVKILKQNNTKR
jgi:hypothetical protein